MFWFLLWFFIRNTVSQKKINTIQKCTKLDINLLIYSNIIYMMREALKNMYWWCIRSIHFRKTLKNKKNSSFSHERFFMKLVLRRDEYKEISDTWQWPQLCGVLIGSLPAQKIKFEVKISFFEWNTPTWVTRCFGFLASVFDCISLSC